MQNMKLGLKAQTRNLKLNTDSQL